MSQLVSRDFKTKYRRSYLGILWSLLNPLFMMIIVSSVFSFVFRFEIENFQVYLILGQVMFNFFSEATQVGVTTIIGSGQLIKKVYLPKYIFPLSKTVFSFLNFLISFIAVAGVLAFYRIPLTLNIIYLPVVMVSYFCFTLGIALFLSAMMVFLRDTQHFYGLFLMGWSYLTPIFYPVSSLADWMQKIMQLNPLYHYITYLRTILLYGTAPSVAQNVVCVVLGILSLTIGVSFFFKRQGKFILYI
ncbi:ABC transporter [Gemmiger sp. An194]|nr:ABC transporter [Gemmiger sp. An194]